MRGGGARGGKEKRERETDRKENKGRREVAGARQ